MIILVFGWVLGALLIGVVLVGAYFVLTTRRIARWAESQVPASGKFIEIDGHKIHYVEAGEGPPVLFLHGLGAQLHHFRHTLFPRLAGDYRLVAIDRPGSGYSTRPANIAGGLSQQAETIVKLMAALRLEKPLVVGHSLGGAVALTLAVEHPKAISGLALLSPLTHFLGEVPPAFRPMYIKNAWLRRLLASTIGVPKSLKFAPQTLAFIFGPQTAPPNYAVDGGGLAGLRPSHLYASGTDFVGIETDLERIESRYGEIDMPVGMFFGTADRVLDYELHGAAMRNKVRGLDLETVEGLGHMPQFVMPDRVAAFIRRTARRTFDGSALVAQIVNPAGGQRRQARP